MSDAIEVFSDMTLRGPAEQRMALRNELLAAPKAPWSFDAKRTEEMKRNFSSSEEVLLFRRDAADGLPAAGLTLWGTADGYYVPNVVPVEIGELTRRQYNRILEDFAVCIARPIAGRFGYDIDLTSGNQGLEDWISDRAAKALRLFSAAANKSTGASHPFDQARWFDFILAVHRQRDELDADRLARWLQQVEGWDERSAHKLAGDFERSISLLIYADQH